MPSSELRKKDVSPVDETTDSGLLRHVRRVIAGVVGVTVLLIGVAMLILPGPAFIVIPLGLSILAAEFAWARRLLRRLKLHGSKVLPERWRHVFGRD